MYKYNVYIYVLYSVQHTYTQIYYVYLFRICKSKSPALLLSNHAEYVLIKNLYHGLLYMRTLRACPTSRNIESMPH